MVPFQVRCRPMSLTTLPAILQLFAGQNWRISGPTFAKCHSKVYQDGVRLTSWLAVIIQSFIMYWRKLVVTNQMTPLRVWQIWAGCALVLHWWKNSGVTLIPTSHARTAAVKSISHRLLMTFCVHFGNSNPWGSWTSLNNGWQQKRERQSLKYLRHWRSGMGDTK